MATVKTWTVLVHWAFPGGQDRGMVTFNVRAKTPSAAIVNVLGPRWADPDLERLTKPYVDEVRVEVERGD